ncbi:MAG: choice-of-anchor J domain-containing protein [Dysgonomonas sp.]
MKKKLLISLFCNFLLLSITTSMVASQSANYQSGTETKSPKKRSTSAVFSEDFATAAQFTNNWTVIDGNSDAKVWTHNAYLVGADGTSKGAATANTNATVANNDFLVMKNPVALSQGSYHLTFQYRGMTTTKKESIRVIYGKTANPSEMTDTIFVNDGFGFNTWSFNAVNFNVAEDGNYYFAFQAFSPASSSGFWLDDITIDAGSFVGTPDITVKSLVLPVSSCELNDKVNIGCTVSNLGTESLYGFDLIYRVNDVNKRTISFQDTINTGASKSFTLEGLADFSAEGTYKVSIIGFNALDKKNSNDTVSGTISHLEPVSLDSLPRSYVFKSSGRLRSGEWFPGKTNAWTLNSYGWKANQDSIPLISRCFDLSPNTYRITFTYRAGMASDGESAVQTEDFKLLFGPTGTDPASWQTVREYKDAFSNSAFITGIASVKIDAGGVYTFAFLPTRYRQLTVETLTVSVNPDNDIKISEASINPIYTMVPAEHLSAGVATFNARVENNGNREASKAKVSISGKDNAVFVSSEEKNILSGQSSIFGMSSSIPGYNAGDTAKIQFRASMESEDQLASDNVYDFSFVVTDTVLAIDKVKTILDMGMGANQDSLKFGSVFHIAKADTLTSISIGWGTPLYTTTAFKLALYQVDTEKNTILHNYFTIDADRALSSSFVSYSIPNLYLQPGDYYVEVQQINKNYLGVASDWEYGKICVNMEQGSFYYMEGFGQLAIRPNFGHSSNIIARDIAAKSIERPWENKGLYSSNEPIKVLFENLGYESFKDLPVTCKVNETVYTATIDTIAPYMTAFATFHADLSSPGEKVITTYSSLENDVDRANDTISRTIVSMEAVDQYKLDFESCENFATGHFNPNWTTIDADSSKVVEFDVTFPHCTDPLPFMAYNPLEVTPPKTVENVQPYAGERYGASFRTESGISNDWLISPKLLLGTDSKLKFYAKTLSASYNLEKFNILVSTTDNDLDSFSKLGDTYQAPLDWTAYEIDLSQYNQTEIHLAIQCVSEKALVFMIDNIEVETDLLSGISDVSVQQQVSLYPNPAKDHIQINVAGSEITEVKILNTKGELIFTSKPNLNSRQMRINTESFSDGIYFAAVTTSKGRKVIKFIVNK